MTTEALRLNGDELGRLIEKRRYGDRPFDVAPAPGAVTEANFGDPGVTDYRNPNLAESMRVLGYVQRFGAGIPTARRLLRGAGHPELVFTATPTHLLATVEAIPETGQATR